MKHGSALSERDFQRQVTDLAELYGWEWAHCRAGRTVDSWRTPMSGTMAQGWPDLVLVHPVKRRLLFVEVKTDTGKLTAHQERVLAVLDETSAGVHVWRPSMWDMICGILEHQEETTHAA